MRPTLSCLLASIAIAVTGLGVVPEGEALGQQDAGFGWETLGGLIEGCELQRKSLEARTVAQSSLPGAVAERAESGWVALHDGSGEVLLLDQNIGLEIRHPGRWSGVGEPPLIVVGGEIGFIDQEGLTLIGRQEVYPIFGEPSHAVADGSGRVFYASAGSVYALDLESRETTRLLAPDDFGMTVDEISGLPPEGHLRIGADGVLYVAWQAQSSIWKVEQDAAPALVAQRCVPEQLLRTHVEAPRVDLTHLGYRDRVKISVSSINDFIVLRSGELLVLGELRVGNDAHRSIELYGADGTMRHAWELAVPMAVGRLDPLNPRRILLWRRWTDGEPDRRLVLMELTGEGYPG